MGAAEWAPVPLPPIGSWSQSPRRGCRESRASSLEGRWWRRRCVMEALSRRGGAHAEAQPLCRLEWEA
eukprot:scaffold226570_cov24-Tisochrysis_lutea.AAC.2